MGLLLERGFRSFVVDHDLGRDADGVCIVVHALECVDLEGDLRERRSEVAEEAEEALEGRGTSSTLRVGEGGGVARADHAALELVGSRREDSG